MPTRRRSMRSLGAAVASLVGLARAGVNLKAMDTIFAFGDSYTASGYTPFYGIRNITGIGQTSSDGLNWLQYLATDNPTTKNSYYDLAVSGATTNNSIVDGVVPSFVDQVLIFQQFFVPVNATATVAVPWIPATTLFVIFIGINDVGFSYTNSRGIPALSDSLFPMLQPLVFNTQSNMIALLYAAGARNFLFMTLPPMNRTPLLNIYGPVAQALFVRDIASYNAQLAAFVSSMPMALGGTQAVLFDTQPFFNQILDAPANYGFQDSQTACPDYLTVTNQPDINLPDCPWPLAEYFWWNTYHPTWPVHKLLAGAVTDFLANGTIVIPTSTASVTVQQTTLPPGFQTALPTATAAMCPGYTPPVKSGASSVPASRELAVLGLVAVVAATLSW